MIDEETVFCIVLIASCFAPVLGYLIKSVLNECINSAKEFDNTISKVSRQSQRAENVDTLILCCMRSLENGFLSNEDRDYIGVLRDRCEGSGAMDAYLDRLSSEVCKLPIQKWASYGKKDKQRESDKPTYNCPNCGAPIHSTQCEYCGTQFGG